VATIYNRFPEGRDGLLAAAFDSALDRLVSAGAVLTVEHLLDHGLQATIRAMVDGLVAVFTDEALVMRSALARLPESRVLRESYRRHEADARSRNHRFVQLGQAAGRIADGDTAELADVLVVMGQGLNNPVLLGSSHRARLVDHLTAAIVAVLEPGPPPKGSSSTGAHSAASANGSWRRWRRPGSARNSTTSGRNRRRPSSSDR